VILNDYFVNISAFIKHIKISLATDFDKGTTSFQKKQLIFIKSLAIKNSVGFILKKVLPLTH